ncbi:MAG: hypothetical protein A3G34_15840 [Candidatus Lindowbacteria bacterium RIFCSPLOWO2_12_FULL_62_27]|nr:MAG: hypothetical protein A3G34_15840 [Candidatus Lindowbacteria bacterium RIFCSPLOWO2_12_FULL_62_27]
MAKGVKSRGLPTHMDEPPADWVPTQAVDEPVINKPYEEPAKHWTYKDGVPDLKSERRPASYYYKTRKTGAAQEDLFAEEERALLPLVNRLRKDVKRWRASAYRGASPVSKDLLAYWWRADRSRRLFFCQLEAVETFIYLLELAIPGRLPSTGFKSFEVDAGNLDRLLKGVRPDFPEIAPDYCPRLVDIPADAGLQGLRRLGCKMATGSGKTIVMAMTIAWAFCNRGRNPATLHFPNGVLVCAPNLTVKERLQVLRPDHPENYYDAFDLVPAKYRELMGVGRVLITNWHVFAPKSPNVEGEKSYKIVNKGEETAEAFAKDRLGELAARTPILVLNDEGHHCWRPNNNSASKAEEDLTKEEKAELEEDAEEARVWLAGLDRINNSGLAGGKNPGILAALDLSATPFYLSNSGYPEGDPFPWLVSDFGLVDAIECGIVKIPRMPVRDETESKDEVGRPDPKYFHLWRHINDGLRPVDRAANRRPKPEAVYREAEGALLMLAGQWKKRFEEIQGASPGEKIIPPVLIIVCDNTEVADIFYQRISGEREEEVLGADGKKVEKRKIYEAGKILAEFSNTENFRPTVRIDTKLLKKIETEEGETKDEAAQALRAIINTVGKRGMPGEQIRCVVSVGMLTEGWDATNVTHILGVRAFQSQLLCEQVVGRGLRRMDYTALDPEGRLVAEHVDVYGIPFSLIPFKGKPKDIERPDPVYHHVFAVPERASLEIRLPVVESYTYDLKGSGISCDVDNLDDLVVDDEPTKVYLAVTRGYQDDPSSTPSGDFIQQTRENFYATVRFQQVVFRLAQMIVDDLIAGGRGAGVEALKKSLLARHQVFPDVLRIVQEYINKKVRFVKGVDPRELALEKYSQLLRERVRAGILPAAASAEAPLLPVVNSYKPFASTTDVNFRTTRPVVKLEKSHLNLAVIHSDWEKDAIAILEDSDDVEFFTPNDQHVGLVVPYDYLGGQHHYEPDFIVRLRGGKILHLILEIKGRAGEIHDEDRVHAKNAAAKKWVAAVNNAGRYDRWNFEICKELANLRVTLKRCADEGEPAAAKVVPFRFVTPRAGEHFKTCVPLVSLRAAASNFSNEQFSWDQMGEWADEWVSFEPKTRFEDGMFVARIRGDSMEPTIPASAYCLFRRPRPGSRQGRIVFVMHSGVSDPFTGGQYTVKEYSSEKAVDPETDWHHTRITLKPHNRKYDPIVLTPEAEDEVRVIAEWVEVVG